MDVEKLSELIHNMWMKWAKSILKDEKISDERTCRWGKCFVPYAELSEEMKELDRGIVRQILKTIEEK